MSLQFTPCPRCHQYPSLADHRNGNHICPPLFYCQFDWQRDEGDEPTEIHAVDAEAAAEKFVEQYDINNVNFTEEAHVIIESVAEQKSYKALVVGEIVRTYSTHHRDIVEIDRQASEEGEAL